MINFNIMKEKIKNKKIEINNFDIQLKSAVISICAAYKNKIQDITKVFPDSKKIEEFVGGSPIESFNEFKKIAANELEKYLKMKFLDKIADVKLDNKSSNSIHLIVKLNKNEKGDINPKEIENKFQEYFSRGQDLPIAELYKIDKLLKIDIAN